MSGDHEELPVAARVRRFEERVISAGLATDAELDEMLGRFYASASPVNGARIVARAWTDAGYLDRLLSDGNAAAAEVVGQGRGNGEAGGGRVETLSYRLRVVANAPDVHNMIVCTLCSCYPVSLLGPSPSWYKSFAYRSRAVREPREVLAEFGVKLPTGTGIAVWDASAETRYLVLPRRPEGTASLQEDELARLVTRNGLIGTAAV